MCLPNEVHNIKVTRNKVLSFISATTLLCFVVWFLAFKEMNYILLLLGAGLDINIWYEYKALCSPDFLAGGSNDRSRYNKKS